MVESGHAVILFRYCSGTCIDRLRKIMYNLRISNFQAEI